MNTATIESLKTLGFTQMISNMKDSILMVKAYGKVELSVLHTKFRTGAIIWGGKKLNEHVRSLPAFMDNTYVAQKLREDETFDVSESDFRIIDKEMSRLA